MGQIVKPMTWQEIIKAAKSGKKRFNVGGVTGLYAECQSFNMHRPSPHGISFFVKYISNEGKKRTIALPRSLSLSEARIHALEIRSLIDKGLDPLDKRKNELEEAKRVEKQQKEDEIANQYTFRIAAEEYIATDPWNWKVKGKAQRKMREMAKKHIYPSIGDIPLKSITSSQVAKILNQVFQHSPVIERKVKTFIKHTFREAIRKEKVKDLKSPFGPELEVLTSGRKPPVPKTNMGAVHHSQIPSFIKALLSGRAFPSHTRMAIVFSITTAARSQAVRYMVWDDVDLVKKTWTIPIENDKMKAIYRNRTIYLSNKACEILKRVPRISGCKYVFPSDITLKPLGENAFSVSIRKAHNEKKLIDGIGWVDPVIKDKHGNPKMASQHGCARATFKTWAVDDENGNCSKYPPAASEYCLLHSSKDPYHGAYNRAQLKKSCRALMEDWGEYCFRGINLDDYLPKL